MNLFFVLLLLLVPKFISAQESSSEFIFVVQQKQSPITFNANTLSSFEIDWHNDGDWEEIRTSGLEEISYEFEGVLDTIRIRGELNHFHAPKKIVDVLQWGDVHFLSLDKTFNKCLLLKSFSAHDTPNLKDVTNMNFTFSGCKLFNGNLSEWDVSFVQTMRSTFYNAVNFDCDLSNWKVSQVNNMRYMFEKASKFNSDLSSWDVTSVKNMQNIFIDSGLSPENYDKLLKNWSKLTVKNNVQLDVSVESCQSSEEKQILIKDYGWKISDAGSCSNEISKGDLVFVVDGNETNITVYLEANTGSIEIDWNNNGNWVSIENSSLDYDQLRGKYISHTFQVSLPDTIRLRADLKYFMAPPSIVDVVQWGHSNFKYFNRVFEKCDKLEKFTALDTPNLSSVLDMESAFYGATSFDGDISDWDVSSIVNMRTLFCDAESFNGDISNWNVSAVESMRSMFYNASSFNKDLNNWDVSSVKNMRGMFFYADSFDGDISGWDVSSVNDMGWMFDSAISFNGNLSDWDVSNVTFMVSMFRNAKAFNGNISGWDVGSVTNMRSMFSQASSFNRHLNDWDVSKVQDMFRMFSGAKAFNGNISDWEVDSVTNMRSMFYLSSFNGDVSNWDVGSVTNMSGMFARVESFNGDVSNWDVSKVETMDEMFHGAKSFDGDLSEWDITLVTDMRRMLTNSGLSSTNYDKLLNTWSEKKVMEGVQLDVSSTFCGGEIGKDKLRQIYHWVITDGGKTCSNSRKTINQLLLDNKLNQSKLKFSGHIEWELYNFTGKLIEKGSSTLQRGQTLEWDELQNLNKKSGILRIFDSSGKVSVIKFMKE
ncbi:BspA family leucine-rich repeat surface protein [Flammeovirga aprica]|uniref:BspA family leucine-rich repeat surface protein n=1 Tax=Flammeovirga aprica JL-4 TaxID=694437 RepID=A0A7X9S127_9BACT|nr:BspA family leucine-rich repeat surface protein [Flammeovirga aprica]NME72294.1 BspA family leucine-rich repeat surface protein [Flammeovirga aprica JL-4]